LLTITTPLDTANNALEPPVSSVLDKRPQRIVSLSPANTEILFALGAGERVVGVSSYSDYPEQAKTKPSIGPYNAPDLEKIIALEPDLVVAIGGLQAQYIKSLEKAGIMVVSVDPQNMEEILTAIDIISEAIGEQQRGAILHAELVKKLNQVRQLNVNDTPKKVFLEVWDAPLLTVGNKSFINDIITRAGGANVASDKNVDYTPCDLEALYAYDPEVYIVISHSHSADKAFIKKTYFSDMAVIKNQQIFAINDDLLTRPGPRSFDGLVRLAQILHPKAVKNGAMK